MAQTETVEKVTRDTTFDIMKGIGILLVLLGHVWTVLIPHIHQFIYSFHMPMFFIVAGYFSKSYEEVPNRRAAIKRYAQRLLLPYLFVAVVEVLWTVFLGITKHEWNAVYCTLFSYLYSGTTEWETSWGELYIGITWFLLALFWAKVMFLYLSRWPKWRLVVSIALAVAALVVHSFLPHTPWCLLLGLTALPFVTLGYEWRHIQLPVWGILILVAFWIASLLFSQLDMYGFIWGIYPITFLGACGATWLLYALCRLCNRYLPSVGKVFAWLGVASLAIMCMHQVEYATHLGNRLRAFLNIDMSMPVLYLWRYFLTLLLAAACMYIPGIKKLFR